MILAQIEDLITLHVQVSLIGSVRIVPMLGYLIAGGYKKSHLNIFIGVMGDR